MKIVFIKKIIFYIYIFLYLNIMKYKDKYIQYKKNNKLDLRGGGDDIKENLMRDIAKTKFTPPRFTLSTEHLQDDYDVIYAFVKNRGSLEYASERLRADPIIVEAAVECNGKNLEYASYELQNIENIVLKSMKEN